LLRSARPITRDPPELAGGFRESAPMIRSTTCALVLFNLVAFTDTRGQTPSPRPSAYPAIGETPAARDKGPMTESDAEKLKKEMNETRDRLQKGNANAPAPKSR